MALSKRVMVHGAVALLLLSSCDRGNQAKENRAPGITPTEILIGSSSALTGHASFLGTQLVHGSLAWLKEVNAKGGVHGRQIKLVSVDDGYEPARTTTMTQRLLVDDGVFMLFDYVGTPTSVKAVPLAKRARVPLLGLFTGAESIRNPVSPWIFHIRDSYYAEAEAAVALFVDRLKLARVGVLYQEDAFGQAVLSGAQLALRRRQMQPVATESYVRGTMNIERARDAMKKADAQAVIMVGTYSPLAKVVKTSHDMGYEPWFHTVSFIGTEAYAHELVDVQKVAPEKFERLIVTQVVPSPLSDLPGVREYRELAKKYFPDDQPNYVALEGFLNAKVLTLALTRAGREVDRDALPKSVEALGDLDLGIGKHLTFGPTDHVGIDGIYYSRLNPQGHFELLDAEGVKP
jgi:branched-chain amino acid transport system substrate-binding protein